MSTIFIAIQILRYNHVFAATEQRNLEARVYVCVCVYSFYCVGLASDTTL